MRKRIILPALLLLSLLCVGFAAQTHTRQQWEYKFEYSPSEKKANELGAQWWELVAIQAPSQNIVVSTYVFKRSK